MKNPYNPLIGLLFIFTVCFQSCDDLIVEDIENERIMLLAPSNNLTTSRLSHTFWWDILDGAENYNMQLVEGSFGSVTQFILDTNLANNKFDYTLYPGSFQWRVKGLNNGGETYYTTFNLTIDSSLNISNQQLILSAPTDNFITNNDYVTFSWNSLLNADDYLIEVHENTWSGNLVHGPQVTTNLSYSTTLPEGTHVWGVQARNSSSNSSTAFSTRTVTIDTTSPNIVTLNTPLDNATLSNTFHSYTWTQGSNSGTAISEVIYFYSDAGATNLVKSANAVGSSHSDSLGLGTFYWRVQSTDAAGNIGSMSVIRQFTI